MHAHALATGTIAKGQRTKFQCRLQLMDKSHRGERPHCCAPCAPMPSDASCPPAASPSQNETHAPPRRQATQPRRVLKP
eukprot:359359-Chlamydomonas_euryale.AAC.6